MILAISAEIVSCLLGIRFQYNLAGASLSKLADFRSAKDSIDIYTCAWGPGPMDTDHIAYLPAKEAQAIKTLATKVRHAAIFTNQYTFTN